MRTALADDAQWRRATRLHAAAAYLGSVPARLGPRRNFPSNGRRSAGSTPQRSTSGRRRSGGRPASPRSAPTRRSAPEQPPRRDPPHTAPFGLSAPAALVTSPAGEQRQRVLAIGESATPDLPATRALRGAAIPTTSTCTASPPLSVPAKQHGAAGLGGPTDVWFNAGSGSPSTSLTASL